MPGSRLELKNRLGVGGAPRSYIRKRSHKHRHGKGSDSCTPLPVVVQVRKARWHNSQGTGSEETGKEAA